MITVVKCIHVYTSMYNINILRMIEERVAG